MIGTMLVPRRLALLLTIGAGATGAHAQQPSAPERVAAVKASLAASQANLRQYEWIETTVVSFKGEEKSREQKRCYYGADGVLQKVVVEAPPPPDQKRGLRGRIAGNKKAELSDYMKSAVALVKQYVPPDPTRIQAVTDAGKETIDVLDPGHRVRINFHDYLKAGDNLGVEFDLVNNRVLGATVSSYLDEPKDAVMLDARMGQVDDGTTYASDITLTAPAKNVQVVTQNSGYRKSA